MTTTYSEPSKTLEEGDILPVLGSGERPANDPMSTVMGFFNAGLTMEAFGTITEAIAGAEVIGESGPGGVFKAYQQDLMAGLHGPSIRTSPAINTPGTSGPR